MFCTLQHRSLLIGRHSLKKVAGNFTKQSSVIFEKHAFSTLSPEEEEQEKARVASLSQYQKEIELREYDREISRLNTLRGINTGELYTIRGKFKALARDYGMPFMAWYWTVWMSTAGLTYAGIQYGGIDAMAIIAKADTFTGFDLTSKVDPQLGTIGVTLVFNELLEPVRLPLVVATTKPVVDTLFPKNY